MHIGFIIDEERLLHERPMLERLAVELVETGANVTRIIPEHDNDPGPADRPVDRITGRIGVRTAVPRLMRRARARRMAAALDRAPPDVLYAVGVRAWRIGRDLRREIDCPLLLDVWSQRPMRRLPRRLDDAAGFVVPTEPLRRILGQQVDPGLISVVPPGVPVPEAPRTILEHADTAIALAIIGTGRDVASYRAMLAALSGVVRDMPQVQAAIELRGGGGHAIWREAQRLDLLPHLSAIKDAAPLRPLLTGCDVLIMPERYGDVRTLTLDAMASGMPVVSAHDRVLDMLDDEASALIVDDPTPETWSREIRRVLSDPDFARRLGAAARERVRDRHTVSGQAERLRATLSRALGGGSYSFAEAAGDRPGVPGGGD